MPFFSISTGKKGMISSCPAYESSSEKERIKKSLLDKLWSTSYTVVLLDFEYFEGLSENVVSRTGGTISALLSAGFWWLKVFFVSDIVNF